MAYNRTTNAATGTGRRLTLAKASSAIALASGLALGASGPAHAQAFEGNPSVVSGGVVINRTTGNDDIQVDTNQAVINWTTNDTAVTGGPINFLPSFRTATYRNNPSEQNQFTVLNRIIPAGTSRLVQFNGTVISRLQTAAGLVPGGNVWFYSPGGIVVNSTAVIDVGGLLLTSSDPVRDGNGDFINGGGSFTLGQSASASSIIVQSGAQITASPQNSYVAMVAPTVLQAGTVNVNGSALYVGAEAATITFGGNGLFDIQVTTGTIGTDGIAVGHAGITTGPASSGAGDNQRIYMVAVPKNNAITMALSGGRLGFDVAGAADAIGNSIVLSAGYNVFGDNVDTTPVNPAQNASISIGNSNVTSAIDASASFQTNVAIGGGALTFAGNARFFGGSQASVSSADSGTITFARDLIVSANEFGALPGQASVGGTAQLHAQSGGTIIVNGSASVFADAFGGDDFNDGMIGSGTGGVADVRSFGNSLLQIDGDLTVSTNGFAGSGSAGATIADGFGGTIIVTSGRNATVDNNSRMLISGNLFATSNGYGSDSSGAGVGGIGRGGSIQIESGSGTGILSSNNVLTINGSILSNADGFGGAAFASGTGGGGFGGNSSINAGVGGRVNVGGTATLTSFGFGGNADDGSANGGAGNGGSALAQIFGSGGILSFGSGLVLQATGVGGVSGSSATSLGGNGSGGTAQVSLSPNQTGGQITVQGLTQVDALGQGGDGSFGGSGVGGTTLVLAASSAGTMALNDGVTLSSSGVGGAAQFSGIGGSGNGRGELSQIVATGSGVITITGDVYINANGAAFASSLTGVDGGDGQGGTASISQNTNGLITINGNALVSATGTGDNNTGGGDGVAGNGMGGDARIAVNDRSITITGNATTDASGFGGNHINGIRGGNGTGGIANLDAGGGTLSIGGDGVAAADGSGGDTFSVGSGGNGAGGQAIIGSIPGGIIQIAGVASGTAQGFGGGAFGAGNTGGLGNGRTAQIFANNGSVTVGGLTLLNGSGYGGSADGGAGSGAALGGFVSLLTQGTGQITLNQNTFLSAQGLSGNVESGAGNAGDATGGSVVINASGAGSAINVDASLFADAIADNGSAVTGTIGNALGGSARIDTASGTVNVTGALSLDASAFAGASTLNGNGGNATGGRAAVVVDGAGGASINIGNTTTLVANGTGGTAQTGNGGTGTGGVSEAGTINVIASFNFGGTISMSANGFGGSALLAGNGGSGTGGLSRLDSNGTQMTGRDMFVAANGTGGNGALGGAGGGGTGGQSALFSGSGAVTGLLDFDNVFLFAAATGGTGGTGATGAVGGTGGAGGNATGGSISATAAAGNGQLDIANLQLNSNATAGTGGAGGTGTTGAGGLGGAGGNALAGFNQFGTESNTAAVNVNVGTNRLVDAISEANGFGGTGGASGTGFTVAGNGGAGGIGQGGNSVLLVRGSLVDGRDLSLFADGFGGVGGAGALPGAGGNGIGGGVAFAITDRFSIPTNRGRLQARDLQGSARAVGGAGSTQGLNLYVTGSNFEVRNADAVFNSLTVNITGNAPNPLDIVEDFVRITDGAANVAGGFTFSTAGSLSTLINNGSLTAGSVNLSAGTFVPDTVVTAPTNIGTITTGSLGLLSGNNLIVTANLNATADIAIGVPGTVTLGNINGGGVIAISGSNVTLGNLVSGNHINLFSSSGAITAGTLTASNFIAMTATNGLTLGLATANTGYIDLLVQSGDLTVGNLTAGTYIALETLGGNIVVGDTQSGEDTDIAAGGTVQFGNANSGLSFSASAMGNLTGGTVTALGALSGSNDSIGLRSLSGNIAVGALSGQRNIGLLAAGSATTGSLNGGEDIIALVSGNIQVNGSVTGATGADRYVYVGDASMASLLGPDLNPLPLFAVTPVRTAGSLTVTGPIVAGNLIAGVGTGFTAGGAITANGGRVGITANTIDAQAIDSTLFTSLNATNGNLVVGNVAAGGDITLQATTGLITASTLVGALVGVDGQGAVSIGGVTAAGAAQLRSRTSTFTSTGAITATSAAIGGIGVALADVTSTAAQIGIGANTGHLSFSALNAATNVQFSAGRSVTGGNITAGTYIGTIVGGDMTLGNLRSGGPGPSAGTFSIGLGANGAIVTGTIDSFGLLGIGSDDGMGNVGNAQSISTGAIVAGGSAFLRSTAGLTTGSISSTDEIRVRGGTVTTGTLTATNAILAAAMAGSLNTGNVTTRTSAALLASQSVIAGAISTATAGTAFIGNSSAIPATGLISTIDLSTLLATTPAPVDGSIQIGGPVTTGTLLASANNAFTANGAITAGARIAISSGGTASFGGLAAAPTISVSSGDIVIPQNGGLGNANTDTLTLTNISDTGMVIGGTTSGEGYTLDASEIARLRAGNIAISSPIAGSTGVGIEVRAFTLNGSNAASGVNLNGADGALSIQTSSTIRVNGNAVFNSMAAGNRVSVNASRVEINADSGGIFLNGDPLGGVLSISANNIHIAGESVLQQLASNITFADRDIALGTPIGISRPGGVIQASRLQFNVGNSLFIQNAGTSQLNAGFYARAGSFEINPTAPAQGNAGLIDVVIYGQLLDSSDTGTTVRTGSAVRNLIFPSATNPGQDGPRSTAGFTTDSSVNGCLLSAASCVAVIPNPDPNPDPGNGESPDTGSDPVISVVTPTVVSHAGPPPPEPAAERENKREKDEAQAAAEEAARGEAAPRRPIMPPVTIVNTRRLAVEPIIDEPVTSGGNPNLQLDQVLPDTGDQP